MNTFNFSAVRRATLCTLTALAIVLPGTGSAGPFDRIASKAQSVKARAVNTANNVGQNRPVAGAVQNLRSNLTGNLPDLGGYLPDLGGNLPDLSLIEDVQALNPRQQFQNTVGLLREMRRDYAYFTGGLGQCDSVCADFRAELKAVFSDYLALTYEVPVLSENSRLIESIQRVKDLIDYIPPAALYQLWQAIGSRVDDLQAVPQQIRQIVASLPVMEVVSNTVTDINQAGTWAAESPLCEWAAKDQKPFIALFQAELERFSWAVKTVADLIPDLSVEGEVGVEAGVGVGMVTGSAAFSLKPSDALKIALKVMAIAPETINWSIKINMLRADALCASAEFAADLGS